MNDASPSASDHAPSHDRNDDDPSSSAHEIASAPAVAASASVNDALVQQKRRRQLRRQREQRAAFLDHLIRNVDIVFYCQLSILYYMECVRPTPLKNCALRPLMSSLTNHQYLAPQIPYPCFTALVLFHSQAFYIPASLARTSSVHRCHLRQQHPLHPFTSSLQAASCWGSHEGLSTRWAVD